MTTGVISPKHLASSFENDIGDLNDLRGPLDEPKTDLRAGRQPVQDQGNYNEVANAVVFGCSGPAPGPTGTSADVEGGSVMNESC